MAKFLAGYTFEVRVELTPEGGDRRVRVEASYVVADTEDEGMRAKRSLDLVLDDDGRSEAGRAGLDQTEIDRVKFPDAEVERAALLRGIERLVRQAARKSEGLVQEEAEPPVA